MCNMKEVKNNVNQLYLYYLGTVGDIYYETIDNSIEAEI